MVGLAGAPIGAEEIPFTPESSISARLVRVADGAHLVADVGGRPKALRVAGLSDMDGCWAEAGRRWLQGILSPGQFVYLRFASTDSGDVGRVGMRWQGRLVDYGLLAVRSGYARLRAFAAETPGVYRDAQVEAMAESRGAWGACAVPPAIFSLAGDPGPAVPANVLYAVALAESARNGFPWPWTLNVGGRALYFRDRRSAWLAAEWLLRHSVVGFDIGLMQLNWRCHRDKLRDAWRALDPETNIRIAAELLSTLSRAKGGLGRAIGFYHSATPALRDAYAARVRRYLDALSRRQATDGPARPALAEGVSAPHLR
jgi:endonuclease YncB( thermonuclease family)